MKESEATMTFDDLTAGSAIFIDANCLVYAFDSQSPYHLPCRRLLDRIEQADMQGFTSAHVLAETSHRLMTIEATGLFNRPLTGMANWLRRHPTEVQRLTRSRQAIDELTLIPVTILTVSGPQVSRAADVSRQYGLLTNDATVVAVKRDNNLTALASHDADFDRVPGITRYSPM
jgi:predicted nucleic acid-binding protein